MACKYPDVDQNHFEIVTSGDYQSWQKVTAKIQCNCARMRGSHYPRIFMSTITPMAGGIDSGLNHAQRCAVASELILLLIEAEENGKNTK